jgi:hypothetical protein
VIAKCDAGRLTLSWDHAKNPEENHDAAAVSLAKRLGWHGDMARGGLPTSMGGNCYVFTARAKFEGNRQVNVLGL